MTSKTTHLVLGAGAVGAGTARRLADSGHQVRVVTRSGSGPAHRNIELVAADVVDSAKLATLAAGVDAIYNCVNPKYSHWATDWPPLNASIMGAAEASGARLVTMGNLYGYANGSSPMAATDRLDPSSRKGEIRVQMWEEVLAAHRAGRIRATEVRASDFFGPGIGATAHMGDRAVPRVLAGKSVSMVGRVDQPHSWTYIEDVCDVMVMAGSDERALGRAWHVPTSAPTTATQMIDALSDAAGVGRVKVKQLPGFILSLGGVFVADLKEMREMMYQFEAPFVIDADDTTETFGLTATPLAEQLRATIASYRDAGASSTRASAANSSAAA